MAKVRSPIRSAGRSGTTQGIRVTPRDRARLAMLGRWYCLTVNHLLRVEYPARLWSPNDPEHDTDAVREDARKAFHNIHHRLGQLRRIETDPARNIGPLVDAEMNPDGITAWYATRYGATAAGFPWPGKARINPLFAAHAWMAADIGLAIEHAGYRVLSEREITTGIDQHGYEIDATLVSQYHGGGGRAVTKEPDLAILAPNGRDFIAVEVERDSDRKTQVYEHKLSAYRNNSNVRAVWYVCASHTTAKRVGTGARKALGTGTSFPLRIVVNENVNGFHFLDMTNLPDKLQADLNPMRQNGDTS